MSVKLTDAQLVMLSTGARRGDLCLTAPHKMKGAVLANVSEKLVKLGLVREVRAKAGMPVWRRDESGQSCALKLTANGLTAVAVGDGSDAVSAPTEAPQQKPEHHPDATKALGPNIIGARAKSLAPRIGSKLATVINLLQRSDGATISNLIEATGWLAHTTRAALTGLRKRGYAVVRERVDGDSVYRIPGSSYGSGDRSVVEPGASDNHQRKPEPKAIQAA
jgi:hypothetical protein